MGYYVSRSGEYAVLTGGTDLFSESPPQFMHAYLTKTFGRIPNLFLIAPINREKRYSQLCMIYMIAYILGMLVRYYPTHWIALIHGERGDAIWPALNQAQRVVEETFPELIAELIEDVLINPL